MAKPTPVRTPLIQQWRRVRYQLMPVLIFAACLAATAWLWGRHVNLPITLGEVAPLMVDAPSPTDGLLAALPDRAPLAVFDTVRAGETIALLDVRQSRFAEETIQMREVEIEELQRQVVATAASIAESQASRQQDQRAEYRRLALDAERLRLDIMDRKALIEIDERQRTSLEARYTAIKDLCEKGLESRLTLLDIQGQYEVVCQRIDSTRKALGEAEAQKKVADERLATFEAIAAVDPKTLLAPLEAAIDAQKLRLERTRKELETLEIRSPINGVITAIHRLPGQAVQGGEPIVTVAGSEGQYIVAYIRQEQRIQPKVGMAVDVRARAMPSGFVRGQVDRVGGQVALVPPHLLRDPRVPEWGLPVRVAIPAGLVLKPGELVDLAFRPGEEAIGSLTAVGRGASAAMGETASAARPVGTGGVMGNVVDVTSKTRGGESAR